MCDYSLGEIQNRLAVEGEELIVHRFPTHTVGLASPAEPQIAVCVPPGATLALSRLPAALQARWNVGETAEVVFTQTSMEVNRHRDAIRFPDGQETLLQNLPEDLRVKIVTLGSERPSEQAMEADRALRESAGILI